MYASRVPAAGPVPSGSHPIMSPGDTVKRFDGGIVNTLLPAKYMLKFLSF